MTIIKGVQNTFYRSMFLLTNLFHQKKKETVGYD